VIGFEHVLGDLLEPERDPAIFLPILGDRAQGFINVDRNGWANRVDRCGEPHQPCGDFEGGELIHFPKLALQHPSDFLLESLSCPFMLERSHQHFNKPLAGFIVVQNP